MSDMQLSRLLRPPVEYYGALSASAFTATLAAAPAFFMMTPQVAYLSAGIMAVRASKFWADGWLISKYHKNLKRSLPYSVQSKDIPITSDHHWLGRGYRFSAKHTQRLAEIRLPENEKYRTMNRLYRFARNLEHRMASKNWLVAKGVRKTLKTIIPPVPDVGGEPFIHGIGMDEEEHIMQPLGERHGHTIYLGTTRVGKSRACEINITSDINRKQKNLVIIFDPKGDAELFKRAYVEAVRAGRENEFYYFNLGDPANSCRYNTVGEYQRITEVASRTTEPLPDAGNSATFKAFAWRFVNVVAQARAEMGERPSIKSIDSDIQDMDNLVVEFANMKMTEDYGDEDSAGYRFNELVAQVKPTDNRVTRLGRSKKAVAAIDYLEKHHAKDGIASLLCRTVQKEKGWYDKLVASLLPFLEKLNTGPVGELLSPDYLDDSNPNPILSWREMIQKGGVVYLGLDAMTDRTVATAVGNTAFNDLVSIAGDMYKNGMSGHLPEINGRADKLDFPEIYLHADEFNSLIGDEFIPMLNQAGGAGIRVTAYTQSVSDIAARLQDKDKAQQVLDNFNTVVMMRVQNPETAEVLTRRLPEVEVKDATKDSDVKNQGESLINFDSGSRDRIGQRQVSLVTAADIHNLPKGQAFIYRNGGQLYKVRFPQPKKDNIKIPDNVKDITARLRDRYSTGEEWWKEAS